MVNPDLGDSRNKHVRKLHGVRQNSKCYRAHPRPGEAAYSDGDQTAARSYVLVRLADHAKPATALINLP